MKKLLIIGPFPNPITGLSLSNRVVENEFKKRGYDVDKINTSLPSLEESVGTFTIKKALYFIKINFKAYKILKTNVVYATIGQSFLGILKYTFFIIVAKILNKEVIIHLHGNLLRDNYESLTNSKKRILDWVFTKVDKGIVLSKSLKSNFDQLLKPNKIYVLTNFVEEYLFLTPLEKSQKQYNKLKIVYLSNLMTEKGIFHFLKSLKTLENEGIEFEAKCAGAIDEKLKDQIMNSIQEINKLEYLGVVSGASKRSLLIWSNVFIFPSYLKEGLPISVLEAMVTGNIIVATPHEALVDNFDSDQILFIPKESSSSISNSLKNLSVNLSSYSKSVKNNFNKIEKFTVQRFISDLENILFK